jgi:hypothetical protein
VLALEAGIRRVPFQLRSAAIMKRGICTFVEKAKTLSSGGAELGLIVNTEDVLIDIPAGKEKTNDCTVPVGMLKANDG